MQVNKDRFPAVLPHFLELLQTCDFYSFDEEMTGINVPEVVENITFSPEESYNSKRLAASRYSVIQVGICLFHKEEQGVAGKAVRYVARPYNFILFPNWSDELAQLQVKYGDGNSAGGGVNKDVVLSPSAISFLRRHGMNWSQWVDEGISLCDGPGARMLRRHLADKYGSDAKKSGEAAAEDTMLFFTDEERAWVTESIAAAERVVQRVAEAEAGGAATAHEIALSREVVLKPQVSRNAREHLRQHAAEHLPTLAVTFRRQADGGGRGAGRGSLGTTTLTALTADEAARRADREAALRQREAVDLLGFRLVFDALVASKKPCVGHNCFADLMFLMAALDEPLPATLAAWKVRARSLFPSVIDTKYLTSQRDLFPAGRFPANYLGGLFDQYGFRSARVHVTVPVGFEAYDPMALLAGSKHSGGGGGSNPAHEAAYDALMTGTLALNLLAEVGRDVATAGDGELANKVALFRSLYALDLSAAGAAADEYSPNAVLDLTHEPRVRSSQLESCLAAGEVPGAILYSVSETRSLAVVPPGGGDGDVPDMSAVAEKLSLRFANLLRAKPYIPPHLMLSTVPAGAKFSFPDAVERAGHAALRNLRR